MATTKNRKQTIDQIRKLLKIAADHRGNPEERKAAQEKADKLMADHGLVPDDIFAPAPDPPDDQGGWRPPDDHGTDGTSGTGIPGPELADAIRDAYNRHIVFLEGLTEAEPGILTLWTLHTHAFFTEDDSYVSDNTPFILVTAPTSEAGKSRVLEVAQELVRRPVKGGNTTPAALFWIIQMVKPTLLMDEVDMQDTSRDMKQILNSGFDTNTPVLRVNGAYTTFCPRMFAGISAGRSPLTGPTLSRCIQIPVIRAAKHERPENLDRQARRRLAGLQPELVLWGRDHADKLAEARPVMPDDFSDRNRDKFRPLYAIAELLGGEWARRVDGWAHELIDAEPKVADEGVQILSDIKQVFDDHDDLFWISAEDLAHERNALHDREYDQTLTARQLGKRLGEFHVRDKQGRRIPGTNRRVRGYTFRSQSDARLSRYTDQWEKLFVRYGLAEPSNGDSVHVQSHRRRKPQR
jgi:hypothetical protein